MSDKITNEGVLSLIGQVFEKHCAALEHEFENTRKEAFENLTESVTQTMKLATKSLVDRQDALEQSTTNRMESLLKKIASLTDKFRHSSSLPCTVKPLPAPGLSSINCNSCRTVFPQLSELDDHIRENHPYLHCNLCEKTLRSKPDLNIHNSRYHSTVTTYSHHSQDRNMDHYLQNNTNHIVQPRFHPNVRTYCCYKCDLLFIAHKDLVAHVQTKHSVRTPQTCFVCESIFTTPEILSSHMRAHHPEQTFFFSSHNETLPDAPPSNNIPCTHDYNSYTPRSEPVHCKSCEATFTDMRLLNVHTHECHRDERNSAVGSLLGEHGVSVQEDSQSEISDILQVDGVADEPDISSSDLICSDFVFDNGDSVRAQSSKHHTSSSRTASFALNKEKQILNLGADTYLPDFDITVNDSDKNVNIQCSTAFYDTVAKPVMCGLNKDSSLNFNNISVNCNHIDYNRDTKGHEYNRVLHVTLGGDGQFSIGKVTIHLHHTKRLLQLQGSASMPDGNRAPVWFLNTFILERFTRAAKLKHLDIDALNEAIRRAVNKNGDAIGTTNNCSECTRQFTTSAKPTICKTCSKYFHKTNCFSSHTSKCKTRSYKLATSVPVTTRVPPIGLQGQLNQHGAVPHAHPHQVQHVATNSSSVNPPKRQRVESEPGSTSSHSNTQICASILPPQQASTPPQEHPSTLNPSAPPFSSNTPPPSSSSAPVKRKNKGNAKTVSLSPEAARISFLNLELNAAKTRIVKLENDVDDRDLSIKLQKEKIRVLEENQLNYVNSKYSTPDKGPAFVSQQGCSQFSGVGPGHCHLQCHAGHHHHPCMPHGQHIPPTQPCVGGADLDRMTAILKEIRGSMNIIKEGIFTIASNMNVVNNAHKDDHVTDLGIHKTIDANDKEDKQPDHIEIECVEIVNEADDSCITVDGLVPEIPENNGNSSIFDAKLGLTFVLLPNYKT